MSSHPPRSIPLPVSGPPPEIDTTVWYADGLQFACTQCGNCCTGSPGYVWLTLDDMERIAGYLRLSFDDFTRTYVRRVGERFALLEKSNYDCTFLQPDGKGKAGCRIYPVRPVQCRTWPFWTENLKSTSAWERASGTCPGMRDKSAPHYALDHIETCRQHPESPR